MTAPKKALPHASFANQLLHWFDHHGRHDLPWQKNKTPYRVWVSEIMLQQTQVNTVIPYYDRFMKTLPSIKALANAPIDQVLHLWTGLGYYTRARNLHQAAKKIIDELKGEFPDTLETIQTLPGIGRSTAGAILSIAFKKHAPILDGNVKRVLTRFLGITKWPGEKDVEMVLWEKATAFTPKKRIDDYSQAIMDLGATLCTRTKPRCNDCPLKKECIAHLEGQQHAIPCPKPKKHIPEKKATFFIFQYKNTVFLEQRPSKGIWGGLWCLPHIDRHENTAALTRTLKKEYALKKVTLTQRTPFRHTFSHYHLNIALIHVMLNDKSPAFSKKDVVWYNLKKPNALGLPAPIKKILEEITP